MLWTVIGWIVVGAIAGWLASIVAIVPGNLGLKESIMGVATVAMGALFSEGVAASLLDRVTMMVVYIVMALVFALPVWHRFNHGKGHLNRNEEPPEADIP